MSTFLLDGTASGQHELLAAADAAATPVAVGRRFAFLSLHAGAGTSTVAALTARALARNRLGRTLVMNATHDDARSLVPTDRFLDARASHSALPPQLAGSVDFRDGVFTTSLAALAGRTHTGGATAADWYEHVAPIARHFDILCTEWKPQADLAGIVAIAGTAHGVCLVAPSSRNEAEHTVALARALHEDARGLQVMVAFTDIARTASTWPRLVGERLPFPTVVFAHDAKLAWSRNFSRSTARSAILAAGALMRSSDQASVTPAGRRVR